MRTLPLLSWIAAGLLTLAACGAEPTGPRAADGYLRLTMVTTGVDLDSRYVVTVSGLGWGWMGSNATALLHLLPPLDDSVTVDISDLDANCTPSDPLPITVATQPADTARVTVHVQCTATARVEIRVSTTGADQDRGYSVLLDAVAYAELGPNDVIAFPKVLPGVRRVEFGGVDANCVADPATVQTIEAVGGDTIRLAWSVSCGLITARRLLLTSDGDLYLRNPGSASLDNLTNPNWPAANARDTSGTWSPDGLVIAFVSNRAGNDEISLIRPDGTGLTNLTNSPAGEFDPAWSPDGTRLAFVSDRDGNSEIYVVNADGSGQRRLISDSAPDRAPTWSPDGTRIAFLHGCFVGTCAAHADVHMMNADGSGRRTLTADAGVLAPVVWSPDGSRLAFVEERGGNWTVRVLQVDGVEAIGLAGNVYAKRSLTWSPDGTQIAFSSDLGIWIAQVDGSALQRVTWGDYPAWSPDGTQIAGVASICGTFFGSCDAFVMNPDGSARVTVTAGHNIQGIAWSPVSSR